MSETQNPKRILIYARFQTKSVRTVLGYSRATLDLQGTDVVHPALNDVLARGGELHALALEVLLVVHGDLETHMASGKGPKT